jgi:CHAT domain-containing protein
MQLNNYLKNPFLIQQANREKFINLSNELYQLLIQPIAKELENKSKLIIIPEKELFHLPFEVLLASNETKPFHELDFLIKGFDISYQYSTTIYQQLKSKPTIKDKSLLAFAPVFEDGQTISTASRSMDFIVDSLYRSIENDKFIGLPNTKKEVETIAKNIRKNGGQTTILLNKKATKSNFQTKLNQPYQFVHIATHGLVNYQNPKLSALACFESGTATANDLLFANEIQMQDIQADLVILSSCESGIGQLIEGEGLIALNRSFIYAGANNVLFSLWKVNDEYTSELMIDFYKSYFETQSYSAALRQAKLKMLENPTTANPRYWAAFVLIGE